MSRRNYCVVAAIAALMGFGAGNDCRAADAPVTKPGLVAEFFHFGGGLSSFPTLPEGQKPVLVRVDGRVDFPNADAFRARLTENFYARWTGVVRIVTPGEYQFFTRSDDGSRLLIDDKLVVDNGGPHSSVEKSGKVELSAGDHSIHIDFFQGGNEAECVVSWQLPGAGKTVIPPAALFHVAGSEKIAFDEQAFKKLRPRAVANAADFGPFLSATVIAPVPGKDKNQTIKGVALKLGGEGEAAAYTLFDTQLCRISAAWTGGYVTWTGVAFDGAHGRNPEVAGDEKFGTREGLGWAVDGNFKDPRSEPFGGLPRDVIHYRGLYRSGNKVVFSYTVGDANILDLPGTQPVGDEVGFTRTIQVGPSKHALTLNVCEVNHGHGSVSAPGSTGGAEKQGPADGKLAILEATDTQTAAALTGAPKGATWNIAEDTDVAGIHLTLPPHDTAETFTVVVWNGAAAKLGAFNDAVKQVQAIDPATLTHGGDAIWKQELTSTGTLGDKGPKPSAEAYVVDTINVPEQNPWQMRVRLSGFDFFPDGHSAALCTWDGDVWVVKGIDEKLEHLTWKRFASGMFQPLGLKIVDGNVYVHGRDQITVLHDLNNDGEADFYENFNNDVAATEHFHEFAFDLQQDPDGNFYIIKGGGVNPGGQGFQRPITKDHGTVMKISKDGSRLENYATGFRAPNGMCVGPHGEVITGDNQGTWTPVDRLNWVKPGGFYGVVDLAHRTPAPSVTDNPLCWIIYNGWDNSCGDPVFCTSDKWGPFKDQLLYLSYGKCSLFQVVKEKCADGDMQGGLVRFPLDFASGAMRARFNPVDGQLYVCGFQGWQTNAKRFNCFQRVRYTGKPVRMPAELHVKDNGVEIAFTTPVSKEVAGDVGSWDVQQWGYRWTSGYGSPEVKVSDPTQQGHDTVAVKSAKVSEDGKSVFLEIPNLKPVMQMLISGTIESADGTPMKIEIANTINQVNGLKLEVSNEHPSGAAVPVGAAQ